MDTAVIIFLLLPDTPLFSAGPAKYRLPPMPPPQCSARSPAPPGADFLLVKSVRQIPGQVREMCPDTRKGKFGAWHSTHTPTSSLGVRVGQMRERGDFEWAAQPGSFQARRTRWVQMRESRWAHIVCLGYAIAFVRKTPTTPTLFTNSAPFFTTMGPRQARIPVTWEPGSRVRVPVA